MDEHEILSAFERKIIRASCDSAIDAGREFAFIKASQGLALLDALESAERRNLDQTCVYCGWSGPRGDEAMKKHVKECAEREKNSLREELEQARGSINMAYDAAKGATREACALVCEAEGRQHPGDLRVFANILAGLIRAGDGVILSKKGE